MAKLSLNDITSRYGATDALNANFTAIEQAIENTLSRDGTLPNDMEANLDMNDNDVINANAVYSRYLYINGERVTPTAVYTPGQAFVNFEFTATAGQTTFSIAPYTIGATNLFMVFVNGISLTTTDFSYTSSAIILPASRLGDAVVIKVFTNELSGVVQGASSVTYNSTTVQDYLDNLETQPSVVEVTGTTQAAIANKHYVLTNVALTTVTLPAAPAVGTLIWITPANGLTTNVVARNGKLLMGLSEDLTLDSQYISVQLRFISDTVGWRIV